MADPHDGLDLVVPSHGGGLMGRFGPGNGFARKGTSMRAVRKQLREQAITDCPHAYNKCRELMDSQDDRVAMVAVKEFFDRFLGRAGDTGWAHDESGATVNIDHLNEEDRARLFAALDTVKALTGERNE